MVDSLLFMLVRFFVLAEIIIMQDVILVAVQSASDSSIERKYKVLEISLSLQYCTVSYWHYTCIRPRCSLYFEFKL